MAPTTFIIPTIGRDTLQRAVDSVVKQAPFLIGNDTKNEGAGVIRNRLIKEAQTEWVSMLDDDDTVTEDYVQRLLEESQAHPEADLIVFREYFIQEHMEEGNAYPDHFIWTAPIVHWGQIGISFSVKREVALKHPFLEEPNEDFHFVERIDQAGYKIHFSKYLVYRARH
jgi:glycosyltransferase involved in cell wall biosynthesis